jgi:hypothetical protein
LSLEGIEGPRFGVAIDGSIVTASLRALCGALNRLPRGRVR